MKILHIVENYAPLGGVEAYVLSVVELLQKNGYENLVIHRQPHPQAVSHFGEKVFYIPYASGRSGIPSTTAIEKIITANNPDVGYLHTVYSPPVIERIAQLIPCAGYFHTAYPVCPGISKFFRLGAEVCQRPFGPGCVAMIYLRHCASARHPLSVLEIMRNTQAYKNAYHAVKCLVVGSEYMRALLLQNGFNPGKIIILPPHFEVEVPAYTPPPAAPVILFVGRLEIEKGLPYLLEAFARLKTHCQLVIAGDGSQRPVVENMAARLGIMERVTFTGWLEPDTLRAAYQNAWVVAIPAVWPEPFGKTGIEAMKYGRPVAAFKVGGIADWLVDGWNGFAVKPKDSAGLAEKLDVLLTQPGLAAEIGQNGRKFVLESFSAQQHLNGLRGIFSSITDSE